MLRKAALVLTLGLALLFAAADTDASPGTTTRVSVASDGTQGNDQSADSAHLDISAVAQTTEVVVVNQRVNDLVWDGQSRRMYVTVPGDGGVLANSIAPFDPYTRSFGTPIYVGANPNKLALSDDGQYLYVGVDGEAVVKRVQLASGITDLTFALGTRGGDFFCFGSTVMGDAEVFPGSGESIVISRKCPGRSPAYEGVAVFDNGVKRPQEPLDSLCRDSIALSGDGTILFGYDRCDDGATIARDTVSASGIQLLSYLGFAMDDFQFGIKWEDGLLYGSDGRIIDQTTLQTLARFDLRRHDFYPIGRVEPDSQNNRAYFLTSDSSYYYDFQAFDLTNRGLLGIIPIPQAYGRATDIIRWGARGVAFATDSGQLILIRSLLIAGPVDSDDDGDGFVDLAEGPCGSDPFDPISLPERIDTPGDDDGDWLVNEALPSGSEGYDCDGDGIVGGSDNCPQTPNPGQEDLDSDGIGDACDADSGGGSYYHPLTPHRILDTRTGPQGVPAAKVGPDSEITVDVTGGGNGVPETNVSAVVVNTTVTGPTADSYLTVYPSGEQRPLASNLNFGAGQTVPNLVTVKVGADGNVKVYNAAGQTHVIFDVVGWYGGPAGGSRFNALAPYRILDTRTGPQGTPPGKVGSNSEITVDVTGGPSGVPATDVSAVVVNTTVTEPTEGSYLTVFPSGEQRPLASNLNFGAGQTVPNLVTVKVGADGNVKVYNAAGQTHVIFDVVGWYGASGDLFYPLSPNRVLDTRTGPQGIPPGKVGSNAEVAAHVTGGNIPGAATGVVVNTTVTEPTEGSYLTVYPSDAAAPPLASNLNFGAGQTVPNLVIVKVGALDGNVNAYNAAGQMHVIFDAVGYFGQ